MIDRCWICGGGNLARFHEAPFDFRQYADEDRDLYAYTGRRVWLVRCASCGFGQPEELPALDRFFERMYAQRWSDDWIAREFEAGYKDLIFASILRTLKRRVPAANRTLLDIGAHAGRFLHLAQEDGWSVEGIELNPRTALFAAKRTGAPVHQINAHDLTVNGRRFGAVVLTDVLEHIPEPMRLLESMTALVEPGGAIAVKVPNGRAQWVKERALAAVCAHRVSVADNLVHVNHFSPRSLALALECAGFSDVKVATAPPELPRRGLSGALRLATFAAASLPGAVHTPLALNLQAYATRA
jgi:2-polyprenyl-3-methyl-5-hydroxy-6-metoxy-1,4-benzoquinol methylase